MPGMGMGLHLGMGMQLQQEQRLEQRLELRLKLALVLDQAQLQTRRDKDLEHELATLRKIHKDTKELYGSIEEFVERVGKRVAKKRRTDGTRSIVKSLRAIVELMEPPLEFMTAVTGAAIALCDHHVHPSDELTRLVEIMGAPSGSHKGVRLTVYRFWEASALTKGTYFDFLGMAHMAAVQKQMQEPAFKLFLQKLAPVAEQTQLLRPVQRDLPGLLPNEPSAKAVTNAFDMVLQFHEQIRRLGTLFPLKLYRAYLDGELETSNELPLLIRPLMVGVSDDAQAQAVQLFGQKSYRRSRDNQRTVLNTIVHFTVFYREPEIVQRLVELSGTARELVALCRAAHHASLADCVRIPKEVTSYADAMKHLTSRTRQTAFARLPFSEGVDAEQILDAAEDMDPTLLRVLVQIATIYDTQKFHEQLKVLARYVEQIVDGRAVDWRYEHELAREQLRSVGRKCESWRRNMVVTKSLASQDAIDTKLTAFAMLHEEAAHEFMQVFMRKWVPALDGQIQAEIAGIDDQFRSGKLDGPAKGKLGKLKQELIRQYRGAIAVGVFFEPRAEEAHMLRGGLEIARDKGRFKGSFLDVIERGIKILDAPEFDRDRTITLMEKDDPFHTLNLGIVPYNTCQRWTDITTQNICLLSHAVDADKKVWYFGTRMSGGIGRAVVRLVWHKKSPMLVLEDIYATGWSEDHTQAFVMAVIEKAMLMSREIGKPVYIGYAWWRHEDHYRKVFQRIAKMFKGKLKTLTITPKMAPSLNGVQYSDTLGGKIWNDKKRKKVSISILTVDTAAEDEAAEY